MWHSRQWSGSSGGRYIQIFIFIRWSQSIKFLHFLKPCIRCRSTEQHNTVMGDEWMITVDIQFHMTFSIFIFGVSVYVWQVLLPHQSSILFASSFLNFKRLFKQMSYLSLCCKRSISYNTTWVFLLEFLLKYLLEVKNRKGQIHPSFHCTCFESLNTQKMCVSKERACKVLIKSDSMKSIQEILPLRLCSTYNYDFFT